jgi:hypothetical protein
MPKARRLRSWSGGSSTRTSSLNYDHAGQLVGITRTGEDCVVSGIGATICTPVMPSGVVVMTDEQGRLQRAEEGTTVTQWSYGASGLMERVVSTRTDAQGVLATTSTRDGFDSFGWLISRVLRWESRHQSPTESSDTYGITR